MTFMSRNKIYKRVDLDDPHTLEGQILDRLFSLFIIRKLTSLSVNYKLIIVLDNGAQNDKKINWK